MRLFVGVEPSAEVRDAAARTAASLRTAIDRQAGGREFRWVPAENLHLTVWFLGEVPESRLTTILDPLSRPFAQPAFVLRLSGVGVFPTSGSPRVLWMGVKLGLDALSSLHMEVGARLQPLGFAPDGRPYSAHLTLARIKAPLPASARTMLREAVAKSKADAGACRIDGVTLFRSRTAPGGARYESLLRVPLS